MLQVVQGLEGSPAQQALIKAAVNSAVKVGGDRVCSSKILGALWRWTLLHGDNSTIDTLVEKVKGMTALQLQPVTDMFVKELGDIKATNEHFDVLASIAAIRIKWLKAKTASSDDTPFTWEMPDAVFRDNARIQAFLRGPEQSMSTTGVRIFAGLPDARKYATRSKPSNASFKMEPGGRGKDAYVTITKTREWFTKQHGEVAQYKNELRLLTDRFGDVPTEDGPAPNRAGVEKRN